MTHFSASTKETGATSGHYTAARSFKSVSSAPSSQNGPQSSNNSALKRNIRYVNSAAYIERLSDFRGGSAPASSVPPVKPVKLEPNKAYESWLSVKSKLEAEKIAQRKREEQQQLQEKKERKHLAEEKYQQWLECKSRKTAGTAGSSKSSNKPSLSRDEARLKVQEWQQKKASEEQRRREEKRLQKQRCQEGAKERCMRAEAAWQRWSVAAANRPKPAPLNRGLFTLNGKISGMFVNPNEWQD